MRIEFWWSRRDLAVRASATFCTWHVLDWWFSRYNLFAALADVRHARFARFEDKGFGFIECPDITKKFGQDAPGPQVRLSHCTNVMQSQKLSASESTKTSLPPFHVLDCNMVLQSAAKSEQSVWSWYSHGLAGVRWYCTVRTPLFQVPSSNTTQELQAWAVRRLS